MTIKPYQGRIDQIASKCAVKRVNKIITLDDAVARIVKAIK